jgi:RNA polymerase sigma factor (sigma-70 family)
MPSYHEAPGDLSFVRRTNGATNGRGIHPVIQELGAAQLLARCSVRPIDEEAWQEFVRRYHSTIRTAVLKTFRGKSREEVERREQFPDDAAEDLVQAVYCRLVDNRSQALQRFKGRHDNSIYQYLMMISVNVVRDHFREMKALKRPKITYSLDEILTTQNAGLNVERKRIESVPEDRAEPPYTMDEIENALRKAAGWRNHDRDVLIFKLHYYEGLTLDEIISLLQLGITAVGVNSILNRISRRMRLLLASYNHRNRH